MIELRSGVVKIMQAIDDQHGEDCANVANQRSRGEKYDSECRNHGKLGERVIRGFVADEPIDDLNEPPRQRWQLVVAELPFAPIGERLDEIERQVGIKEGRQRGPNKKMHR